MSNQFTTKYLAYLIAIIIIILISLGVFYLETSKAHYKADLIVTSPFCIDTLQIVAYSYKHINNSYKWYHDDSRIFSSATFHRFELVNGDNFTIFLLSNTTYQIINIIEIKKD